jgi:hypothetical protein
MGFGALYLLGCSGLLIELYRCAFPDATGFHEQRRCRFLSAYMIAMVVLAWAAVLSGTYIVYPWYRVALPHGPVPNDLANYPQRLLLAHASTSGWHTLGMEWKEHVAWLTPIAITMAASIVMRYGSDLRNHRLLRNAVIGFTVASFATAGAAGFFGAMINKYAPIQGGKTIQLTRGETK